MAGNDFPQGTPGPAPGFFGPGPLPQQRYGMGGAPIPIGNSPAARLNGVAMAGSPTYRGQMRQPGYVPPGSLSPGQFSQIQNPNYRGAADMGARMGQMPSLGSAARSFANAPQAWSNMHGGSAFHNPNQGPNAVQQARMQGPDPAAIQADMQRRQIGANIGNANPNNAVLAGYMQGQ